jgi:hypothetical protein
MKVKKFDFSGYATRNNLKCTDGRTILKDAFKDNDGMKVPLVWAHLHNEPGNVLGHGVLENRDDGVYVYGVFNDTEAGQKAKKIVDHGDITNLSIYANQLDEHNKNVMHGNIREVSLVMAGANPGAFIDNVNISHADGSETTLDDEAIIYTDSTISMPEVEKVPVVEEEKVKPVIVHADAAPAEDQTVGDIFDTLTEEQKTVVYAIVAEAVDAANADGAAAQSDNENGDKVMKHNVFADGTEEEETKTLSHADFNAIIAESQRDGSFKKAFFAHAGEPEAYGFDHPDYLFPDARTAGGPPAMIQRRMEWVANVMAKTYHTPFSRIKTVAADITADAARAKGYVKGAEKVDEVIKILRRTTTPTTVYKKQKLDRDDILDITDFDVVVWLKGEMRVMLDEEVARAVLVGDGRQSIDPDKIDDTCIRPIYGDDDLYAYSIKLAADVDAEDAIDAVVRGRNTYNGSGTPTLYCTPEFMTDMLLLKDGDGHRFYNNKADLATALLVSDIVEVPTMEGLTREDPGTSPETCELLGIVVNLRDYTIGADKGAAIGMFDDFDIDFNQYKYLIETRISGALSLVKSAMIIERSVETLG